ncbi:nuclear factor 7, ovary-like [Hemitrygon akajei]|uniref:nuclear factor 7, ovary-like n=1 Tax=Hemitrygon akajei TaxID=2704970 RepID=UPI003BF94D2C
MEKNLRETQENIRIIQEEISKLKEQMDQKDSVIFLKQEARRNRRINDDIQELSVTDETLPVEKFDHLYLLNTVLRETLDAINRVSVTLDVETAGPYLEVSEDRKSMRWTETWRNLPDTGKRFTHWASVLGAEGFTSGRHYWEVEVTGNRDWFLGVATESVERKRGVSLSPETGFWVIRRYYEVLHRDCDVFGGPPWPESRLAAGPIPGRVMSRNEILRLHMPGVLIPFSDSNGTDLNRFKNKAHVGRRDQSAIIPELARPRRVLEAVVN